MIGVKDYLAGNAGSLISKLVDIGMKGGAQGKQLVRSYYNNPPPWMTPSEAKIFVPMAAERLDRIGQEVQKINPPTTTVAEDKVAGLASLAQPLAQPPATPEMQAPQQQAQPPAQPPATGVAALDVPDEMFQETNMAGGGIVAFDDGGEVPGFASGGINWAGLGGALDQQGGPSLNPRAQLQYLQSLLASTTDPAAQQEIKQQMAELVRGQQNAWMSKYPGLREADQEVQQAKTGIAGLASKLEYSPDDLKKMSSDYMEERSAAGDPFRKKAEELMGKQEARVQDMGKDTGLKAAFNFFSNLAASSSPYFAQGVGTAGKEALKYWDDAKEKQDRAQASLEGMQMNYNLARAAEAKGDLDARDRYMNAAKDDRRNMVSAQVKLIEAGGNLAAKQVESALKNRELDLKEITANADTIRANAAAFIAQNPAAAQTFNSIRQSLSARNEKGAYSKHNGGNKLDDAQLDALTTQVISGMHGKGPYGGGTGTDKLNTIRNEVGKSIDNAINTPRINEDARLKEIRAYNKAGNTKAANKLKEEMMQEEFRRRTTSLGYTGPGAVQEDGTSSLFSLPGLGGPGGTDPENPLGLKFQ